jgi:hypothetical protein
LRDETRPPSTGEDGIDVFVAFKEIPKRELRVAQQPHEVLSGKYRGDVAFKEIPKRELRASHGLCLEQGEVEMHVWLHSKKSQKGN